MPNARRGEVALTLGATRYTLCLTLGALAELEAAFGADDLIGLAARFETGRFSARDAIRIIGAGLRGAGHDLSDEAVARLPAVGGAAAYVRLLGELLAATFGGEPVPVTPAGEGGDPVNPSQGGR